MENNIEDALKDLGYDLIPDIKGWRSSRIYAGGNNPTALLIYKDGSFVDFAESKSGPFEELVKLTLQLKDISEAKDWVKKNIGELNLDKSDNIQKHKIKIPKIFPPSFLHDLVLDHTYFINRGFREDVIKEFCGGLIPDKSKHRLRGRYVFPIFNSKKEILGLIGRDVINNENHKSRPKYKILGEKSNFVWPAFINLQDIKREKKVILVESPACVLALFNAGIRNVICLFGTKVSIPVLNFLLKIGLDKIYISTNNEENNDSIGNKAAASIQNKLLRFYDKKQIQIVLPTLKDFGCQTKEMNEQFYKDLK